MQHILGLHQPYYERSAPSLVEWVLDASAALADRRRHGRVRTDGREGLGAAGLFRHGRMDAANVGSLAGLTSLGRVPPTWFSLFEQRDAFRPTHPPAMLNWGTSPDLPAASSLGGLKPALVDRR